MRSRLVAWSLAALALAGAGAVVLAGVGLAHDPGTVEVTVWAHEYHFETNRTEGENPDFTLDRGATYEITLVNNGSAPHSFWLAEPVGEGTQQIGSGEQTTVTVDVPWDAPDTTFDYFCTVSGHRDLGMEGGGDFHGGNTAPDLSVDEPGEDATVQGEVTLEGEVLDDEDGPDALAVEVKTPTSEAWEEAETGPGSGWSFTWDSTAVDDGEHTLEVRATDHHGLADEATRTLEVVNDQNAPPTIDVEAPAADAEVRGEVTVSGSASDPEADLSAVEVKLPPGDDWQPADGLEDWSVVWNASGLDPGSYTLEARAVDAEGATATVDHPLEVVEETANRAPRLTLSHPEDGATVEGDARVAGNATDPDGDAVTVEVQVPGSTGWRAVQDPDAGGAWELAWDASDLDPGTYTLAVRASDGDDEVEREVTVQVPEPGNNPPTVSFATPQRDDVVSPPVTVVVAARDIDEGDQVESVRVRFAAQEDFQEAAPAGDDRWRVEVPGDDLPAGPASLTAVASDGDEVSRATLPVEIAGSRPAPGPVVEVTSPPPDRADGLVAVRGIVPHDSVRSPPVTLELRVDGEVVDLLETAPGRFQLTWNPHGAEPGVRDLTVQAFEGPASSEPVTFAVRVGPPAEAAGEGAALPAPGPGLGLLALAGAAAAAGRRQG